MEVISTDDSRLEPYRNLKDRDLARDGGRFIAESEHVVRRLLASDHPVESVLCGERHAAELSPLIRPGTALLVVPDSAMNAIVGFKFHSGVIACGRRLPSPPLESVLSSSSNPSLLVIAPDLISHENLGSLIRIAAAFAACAVLIGPRSCDPFYRMSIRVSMGTVFSVPLVRSTDLLADLARLRGEFGYQLLATVLDEDAVPLQEVEATPRVGLLFGNEAQGLDPAVVAACDRKITLPMRPGVDSLNIAVAAGIFVHHFAGQLRS